jgi:hypothetical protein
VSDLYRLDGLADATWDHEVHARLRVVLEFVEEAVKLLDEVGVPEGLAYRMKEPYSLKATIYDQLADLAADVIFAAAAVTKPTSLAWSIQHNSVWYSLTRSGGARSSAWGAVRFKLRRLLYDDIKELESFPNFKGARILGYCLNVMGLKMREERLYQEMRPLHSAVLRWTKRNFASLLSVHPPVAEGCLVEGITYDQERNRLVRTYPADGLSLEPSYVYLELDPPRRKEKAARRPRTGPKGEKGRG